MKSVIPIGLILLFSNPEDFLMVMGGSDSQGRISDVELVSLDPANSPVPECLNNLASLSLEANGAAAGMTSGKEKNGKAG